MKNVKKYIVIMCALLFINVNIKMYIFDHLRMYKFAHSSSCIIYSLKRYDFPVMFITCA